MTAGGRQRGVDCQSTMTPWVRIAGGRVVPSSIDVTTTRQSHRGAALASQGAGHDIMGQAVRRHDVGVPCARWHY